MRDDMFVYLVDMPDSVKGVTTPCEDGYTTYINSKLTYEQQLKTLDHEERHLNKCDFEKFCVGEIEVDNV